MSYRTYADSLNPPILHRKELLLPEDDPRREVSAALTVACESVGLFDDSRRIGYLRQWEHLVRERGYRIVDHQLVPLGNQECDDQCEDGESDPEHTGADGLLGMDFLGAYRFELLTEASILRLSTQ